MDGTHPYQLKDTEPAGILRQALVTNKELHPSPSWEQMKPETKTRIESWT